MEIFFAYKHVRLEKDIYSVEALLQNNVLHAKELLDLLVEFLLLEKQKTDIDSYEDGYSSADQSDPANKISTEICGYDIM